MIPETLPQAHVEQYFGLWAIQEEPFRAAVAKVEGIDLTVHVAQQRARPDPSRGYQDYSIVRDNVALIELNGPLMKYSSSLSGGTSTVAVRRQIRNAVEDEQVASILMVVDSPGGTVAGTFDLVDEVAKAAKRKPLWAYIEDLGASAAYAVASQAYLDTLRANRALRLRVFQLLARLARWVGVPPRVRSVAAPR